MTHPAEIGAIVRTKDVLGFTGTQHRNPRPQGEALLSALVGFREAGVEWMHNGDCVNSDHLAAQYWATLGGKVHLWPPEIDAKRAFFPADVIEKPKSYLVRNRDIVNSCTILIATPRELEEQQRGGTWSTVRYARLRSVPIMFIWPDGTHTLEGTAVRTALQEAGE